MTIPQRTSDWWLWRMYRQVADFIHQPSEENARRLRALIEEYRATGTEPAQDESSARPAQYG